MGTLSRDEVLGILTETGVLKTGHFLLSSGRHSDRYLQCVQVLQYPWHTEALGRHIASFFSDMKVDLVLSPAMGGIVIGYEVARGLGVRALFCEREGGVMQLRRNQAFEPGSRIVIVEDVLTTGKSVREVMDVALELKGEIVGVGAIVDRSAGQVRFGVPTHAAIELEVPSFEPVSCHLCKQGLPLVKPGSRSGAAMTA